MIAGAVIGAHTAVTVGAAAFALLTGLAAVYVSIAARHTAAAPGIAPTSGDLLAISGLTVIAYAWGAASMQGLYITPMTGLKWQHGWQYASVMALLALGSWLFRRTLRRSSGDDGSRNSLAYRAAGPLAAAQALVAGGGLAALALSGKLWSTRADWAANRVFAALAVAILATSLASLIALLPRSAANGA